MSLERAGGLSPSWRCRTPPEAFLGRASDSSDHRAITRAYYAVQYTRSRRQERRLRLMTQTHGAKPSLGRCSRRCFRCSDYRNADREDQPSPLGGPWPAKVPATHVYSVFPLVTRPSTRLPRTLTARAVGRSVSLHSKPAESEPVRSRRLKLRPE